MNVFLCWSCRDYYNILCGFGLWIQQPEQSKEATKCGVQLKLQNKKGKHQFVWPTLNAPYSLVVFHSKCALFVLEYPGIGQHPNKKPSA